MNQADRTGGSQDIGGDFLADGIEIRSIHVGGGQLWDGPGPVDGASNTQDGAVLDEDRPNKEVSDERS